MLAVQLGREHHLVAPPLALRKPVPDDLLGMADMASVWSHAVPICGVEEIDPVLQRTVHDAEAFRFGRLLPQIHRAKTEGTYQ